jgi:hydroxypyruvate isomerase
MNWPNIAQALKGMGYSGPIEMKALASSDADAAVAP